MTTPRRVRRSIASMALSLAAACDRTDHVKAWLTCDCNIELQRTVAMGDDAVASLTTAVRDGPSPRERANYGAQVAEQYRMARRFRDGNPGGLGPLVLAPLPDSASFVREDGANFMAGYQKRAAFALRGLGTSAARQALHQAVLDHASGRVAWRPDVREYVLLLDRDQPVTSVTITSPVRVLGSGSVQLTARVRGAGLVAQDVSWFSSNNATVSDSGLLTRIAPGSISARACSRFDLQVCGTMSIAAP